jgi:ketosteroid isomerase-like protein
MERSPELAKEINRLYDAFSRGDADLMEELTTADDGLVFIGTDPDEWFSEVASVRKLLEAQAGSGVKVEHGDAAAYEEGTVGWVADRGHFLLPDGNKVPFRMTAVFHRENGAWKLVQEHASVAVTNEDSLGVEI